MRSRSMRLRCRDELESVHLGVVGSTRCSAKLRAATPQLPIALTWMQELHFGQRVREQEHQPRLTANGR
jgi:hypothetical protein